MKKICFFFFLLFSLQSFSQKVVLKNNLVYDALLTPNLSVEFSLGKKWTLDTQIGMNFFFYENDATANGYKTKKWSHWLVQPEIRYWTCETFNGWFLGLHAHGGQIILPSTVPQRHIFSVTMRESVQLEMPTAFTRALHQPLMDIPILRRPKNRKVQLKKI